MKKFIIVAISFFFLFIIAEARGNVFCEEATTTTCHACPAVSDILHDIYTSGQYPFYYVSLVADKNGDAAARASYYNVYGYPTTFFDGGYEVIFGKKSRETFENAIQSSLQRERSDITLTLNLKWLGGNAVEVHLTVHNNENVEYDGILKVYMVEPTSRWNNDAGEPYHFGFLGYAVNEAVTLAAGEQVENTVVWNASHHGYEIHRDNIMAIAVVFDSAGNTSYSDPPDNNHPFVAHYVDACTAGKPPPDSPPSLSFLATPENVYGYRNCTFEWQGSDDFGNVLFSYRLEGYEAEWHTWGDETSAIYTDLPDGEYTFLLRGKDSIGQVSEISWKFTVDTGPPTVMDHRPQSGERNVPIYTTIKITFSHAMNKTSVLQGMHIEPPVSYTVQWNDGSEVTIHPQSLAHETTYTVTLRNARRVSGQMMGQYSFSFETSAEDENPPYVISVHPFNDELEKGTIDIIFSEPMDTLLHNAILVEPWISFSPIWKDNDTLLSLQFQDYIPGTYRITITDYITDKSGNFMQENFSFEVYITQPEVIYTSIENGEKNVGTHTTLQIKFSHEMDRESVEENLAISPSCTYDKSWEDTTLFIELKLEQGKTYHVTIASGAHDVRNISLKEPLSLSFSTVPEITRDSSGQQTPAFTLIMAMAAVLFAWRKRRSK
ncbi:MAG TPA: hypothetical protein ENG06_07015 [Thermoplasmatales archaeon]|nr:hypothetical protein [Thermoplasmatales archaeon]